MKKLTKADIDTLKREICHRIDLAAAELEQGTWSAKSLVGPTKPVGFLLIAHPSAYRILDGLHFVARVMIGDDVSQDPPSVRVVVREDVSPNSLN